MRMAPARSCAVDLGPLDGLPGLDGAPAEDRSERGPVTRLRAGLRLRPGRDGAQERLDGEASVVPALLREAPRLAGLGPGKGVREIDPHSLGEDELVDPEIGRAH